MRDVSCCTLCCTQLRGSLLPPVLIVLQRGGGRGGEGRPSALVANRKLLNCLCSIFLQRRKRPTSQTVAARRKQRCASWRKRSSRCWPACSGVARQAQQAQHVQQAPRAPLLRAVAVPAAAGGRHRRAGEAAAAVRQRAAAGSGPGQQQQQQIEMHPQRPTGAATSLQVIALNASHGAALQCYGICASKPPFPLSTVRLPPLPAPQASECAGSQLGGPSAGRHFLCRCPPGSVRRLPWCSSSSGSNRPAAATAACASRRTRWRRGVVRWGSSSTRHRAQPWRSVGLIG